MGGELKMKVPAEWSDDCGGKKNFDGDLVSVCVTCFPGGRGGSSTASASILLLQGNDEDDDVDLVRQEFTGQTQEEAQRQVEVWVQAKYEEIAKLLMDHFQAK
jgi:hypothetical protein